MANRDHQELFATELEAAIRILALLPGAGTPYTKSATPGLRRLYLRKLACHLYYTFDDEEVIVRAMWGAKRERAPNLF
jgi:plasmid stabilization system protein ParE